MAGACQCTDEEIWDVIPGCESYYDISSRGQVRSLSRVVPFMGGMRSVRGRILAPRPPDLYGHINVSLCMPREPGDPRRMVTRWVHQLVAEAFLGPRPEGAVVCHKDGDAAHNHVQNLRWDTPGENRRDQKEHGTDWQANKVRCKWGHLLVEPNLMGSPSYIERGWRKCKACSRAHNIAGPVKRRGPEVDFETIAERAYRAIMAGQSEI